MRVLPGPLAGSSELNWTLDMPPNEKRRGYEDLRIRGKCHIFGAQTNLGA